MTPSRIKSRHIRHSVFIGMETKWFDWKPIAHVKWSWNKTETKQFYFSFISVARTREMKLKQISWNSFKTPVLNLRRTVRRTVRRMVWRSVRTKVHSPMDMTVARILVSESESCVAWGKLNIFYFSEHRIWRRANTTPSVRRTVRPTMQVAAVTQQAVYWISYYQLPIALY